MNDSKNSKTSWWHTVPGILTGIAAVITGVTGLLGLLYQLSVFDGNSQQSELKVDAVKVAHNNDKSNGSTPPSKSASSTKTMKDFLYIVPSIWKGEIDGKIYGRTMLYQTFRQPTKIVFDPSRTTENKFAFTLQSSASSDKKKSNAGLINVFSAKYGGECFSIEVRETQFTAILPSESYNSSYCDTETFKARVTKRHEPEQFIFDEVTLTMSIHDNELRGTLKGVGKNSSYPHLSANIEAQLSLPIRED
jgi:hypothetical protein